MKSRRWSARTFPKQSLLPELCTVTKNQGRRDQTGTNRAPGRIYIRHRRKRNVVSKRVGMGSDGTAYEEQEKESPTEVHKRANRSIKQSLCPYYYRLSAWNFPELPQLFRREFWIQSRMDCARAALALAVRPSARGMDSQQPIQLWVGRSISGSAALLFPLATTAGP